MITEYIKVSPVFPNNKSYLSYLKGSVVCFDIFFWRFILLSNKHISWILFLFLRCCSYCFHQYLRYSTNKVIFKLGKNKFDKLCHLDFCLDQGGGIILYIIFKGNITVII